MLRAPRASIWMPGHEVVSGLCTRDAQLSLAPTCLVLYGGIGLLETRARVPLGSRGRCLAFAILRDTRARSKSPQTSHLPSASAHAFHATAHKIASLSAIAVSSIMLTWCAGIWQWPEVYVLHIERPVKMHLVVPLVRVHVTYKDGVPRTGFLCISYRLFLRVWHVVFPLVSTIHIVSCYSFLVYIHNLSAWKNVCNVYVVGANPTYICRHRV